MGLVTPVAGFLALVAFVAAAAALCHWLLEPVNRAAGHLNAPTRFLLTDFLWLMMQLQVVLAIVMQTVAEAVPQKGLFIILALICLPVLVLWGASVSVVSRAGITRPLQRAVVILLLVPGSLAEVMAIPILAVGSIVLISGGGPARDQLPWTDDLPSQMLLIGLLLAGAIGAAFVLRRLSFWVLEAAPAALPLKT